MPVICLAFLVALASGASLLVGEEPKKPTPKFKLGKDTTFVTGPLDQDGYLDYEAALNERLKGKSTPESNAVVLLVKALGPKPEGAELHPDFYQWLGIGAPPADGVYLKPRSEHFEGQFTSENMETFEAHETLLRQGPWKAEDAPKHADWLRVNEKSLALAIEATRRKDYFLPMVARGQDGGRRMLIHCSLPTVQKNREIALLLSLRVTLRLGEGKVDAALEDALAMRRLGVLVASGATLIESLVGAAVQTMAHQSEAAIFEHGKPTAKQALAYQVELLKLPPRLPIADQIACHDRLMFLDAVQALARDKVGDFPDLGGFFKPGGEFGPQAIDFEVVCRFGNRWYDEVGSTLRKPTRAERAAGAGDIGKRWQKFRVDALVPETIPADPEKWREQLSERAGKLLVALLVPAFQKVAEAADRVEQMHRNALILTALAAYHADEKKYPKELDGLVPKYLKRVPDDVFNGKELIYCRVDTGYLLYSVGPNEKDDGGTFRDDRPRGDDIGVRLPRK
jgi:hypothetical protein